MQKKLIIAASIFLFLSGCDLFETRTPESPDTGRSTYIFPSSPDIVVTNFVSSLKEKNTQNYMACFVDSLYSNKAYHFFPTPAAASRYPAFLLGWSEGNEQVYLKNILAKVASTDQLTVSLYDSTYTRYANDSIHYEWQYIVKVPDKSSSQQSVYSGRLLFSMVSDSRSAWVITNWTDFGADTGKTWSDLKGLYY